MLYCPICKAEVPVGGRFCAKCGFNQVNGRRTGSASDAPKTKVPAPPRASSQQDKRPVPSSPPSTGLIRPIGIVTPPRRPTNPIIPTQRGKGTAPHFTPKHLLTLKPGMSPSTPVTPAPAAPPTITMPVTPPSIPETPPVIPITSPFNSTPVPESGNQQLYQQFMQMPFVQAKEQAEQHVRQVAEQETSELQMQRRPNDAAAFPPPKASLPQQAVPNRPVTQPRQMPEIEDLPTTRLPIEVHTGRTGLKEDLAGFEEDAESFVITSAAAEHWRTSWRNRQRTEAGPATDVSRGHSAVPEPLLAMQQSLLRLRAVVVPGGKQQEKADARLGFWITIVLMVCLIGGLGAYIASTYLPATGQNAAQINTKFNAPPPSLTIEGTLTATVVPGQTLHLHGSGFDAGAPIIFLLDGNRTINGTDGRELAVTASNQGTFDVTVPITAIWSAGTHMIVAENNQSDQKAELSVQIGLAGTPEATSPNLALSARLLKFQTVMEQGNPPEQFVRLTDTNSTTPLQWTTTTIANDDLNWLAVDTATRSGTLQVGESTSVGIDAIVTNLTASSQPYMGDIVFTINGAEQLTLPVELEIQEAASEIVINPNPLTGSIAKGNSCQGNAQLLFVNLGNTEQLVALNMNTATRQHIQFLYEGQPYLQGSLAPSGETGDTLALTLACTQVQPGNTFSFTIQANNASWTETVTIQ